MEEAGSPAAAAAPAPAAVAQVEAAENPATAGAGTPFRELVSFNDRKERLNKLRVALDVASTQSVRRQILFFMQFHQMKRKIPYGARFSDGSGGMGIVEVQRNPEQTRFGISNICDFLAACIAEATAYSQAAGRPKEELGAGVSSQA